LCQQQPPQPKPGKPKPLWKPPGKACAFVAANGPDANSTITAAIAAMLKATPVYIKLQALVEENV
jgi:hypothetical protein